MDEEEMMGLVKGDLASFISYLVEVLSIEDSRRSRVMKDTQSVKMMLSYVERIRRSLDAK